MPKIVLSIVAAVALATVGAAIAHAASSASAGSSYTYKAAMSAGSETPKPQGAAGAKGTFSAMVSGSGATRTLAWKITFSGLSGKAVAAHVHKGKAGVAGPVVAPLCGPCRSGQAGTARISSAAADALQRGQAYVNVHTAKNQGGEIRGQVKLTGTHAGSSSSGGGASGGGQSTSPSQVDTTGGIPGY